MITENDIFKKLEMNFSYSHERLLSPLISLHYRLVFESGTFSPQGGKYYIKKGYSSMTNNLYYILNKIV